MQGWFIGSKIGLENRIKLYYFPLGLQNQPPTRGEFQTGSKFLAKSNVTFVKKKLDGFSNYEAQILGEQTTSNMGEQMLGEMEDIEVKGELPQLLLLLYIPIILVS